MKGTDLSYSLKKNPFAIQDNCTLWKMLGWSFSTSEAAPRLIVNEIQLCLKKIKTEPHIGIKKIDWSCGLRNVPRVSDLGWASSIILVYAIVIKYKETWQMKLTGDSEWNYSTKKNWNISDQKDKTVLGSFFKVPFHDKKLIMKTRKWSCLRER